LTRIKRAWQRLTMMGQASPAQVELAEKYKYFVRLLFANNQVLALMADLEEKLSGDYLFDFQYIRATVEQLRQEGTALVEALNGLGDHHYQNLTQVFQGIMQEVEDTLYQRRGIPVAPLVLFFDDLDLGMMEVVGGKSANLGEVKNRLGLPVPPGFAISSYAYKTFLDYNHLVARISTMLGDSSLDDLDSFFQLSEEIKQIIRRSQVPPDLESALPQAYERLAGLLGGKPLVAMRFSVVGEDLAFTFASRYTSYLNISSAMMLSLYKEIVASLFTPRALFHYHSKGFLEEELAMGVAVMSMIHPMVSGVLLTRHPEGANQDAALIKATWGLSSYAEGGPVNLDHYLVAYQPEGQIIEKNISPKPTMLVCRPDVGMEEVPVRRDFMEAPCLNDHQITQLLKWALILEAHYRKPQEVAWAIDYDGQFWLLQSQSLQLLSRKEAEPPPRTLKQYPVLISQGTVVCRGVGAGPVVMVRTEDDLKDFPEGGVLVTGHTSPKYATVMPKAAAVIADVGSPTGHMALLAREFQIPTILNTGIAMEVLKPGQEVTVDANYNNVYAGMVKELLKAERAKYDDLAASPIFRTLRAVVSRVVPLNLLNPQDESFAPEYCRTLHDVVRCAHEFSMREMFSLTEKEIPGKVSYLDLDLPFKISILDIGGGLEWGWRRRARPEQILSLPFKAFCKGLAARRRSQAKPEAISTASPLFADSEGIALPASGRADEPGFLVLSKNYMNFRIHLRYHHFTVEAYVSDQINDNYLTFHFRSSGANPELWSRLLEAILARWDFRFRHKGDFIEARFAKYPPEIMAQRLVLLGRLTLYINQPDLVLFSEDIVNWCLQDFLLGQAGIED
jgi:pyruvate,water dikinase